MHTHKQTPTSTVQRNLFSSATPLLSLDGLQNGLNSPSPFVPPFSLGPPTFPLDRDLSSPVKTPPRVSTLLSGVLTVVC